MLRALSNSNGTGHPASAIEQSRFPAQITALPPFWEVFLHALVLHFQQSFQNACVAHAAVFTLVSCMFRRQMA